MDFLQNDVSLDFTNQEEESFFRSAVPSILNNTGGEGDAGTSGGTTVNPPDETDDDPDPDPKPFPDIPRTQENADQVNIYALLVGINSYHDMDLDLKGCLNDVKMVEDYLRRRFSPESTPISYTVATSEDGKRQLEDTAIDVLTETDLPRNSSGRLHVCVLRDEQATYGNIIRAFETHFEDVTGEDTVFFHFSGHGTEQFTAKEFADFREDVEGNKTIPPIVASGKDQALVCFRDQEDGPMFLRDKELAKLINNIETKPSLSEDKKPHIVISFDACHSGAGTREFTPAVGSDPSSIPDFAPRSYNPDSNITRDAAEPGFGPSQKIELNQYYGNYRADNLEVPNSNHILLSACESRQLAGDTRKGGIFTTSLIETLNKALDEGTDLHYGNLFTLCRATAIDVQKRKKLSNIQNPQMDSLGGFDPFTCFLEGWPLGVPGRYEMFESGGHWFVKAGAVHSLPKDGGGKIKVQIYDSLNQDRHVANGMIQKIGAQHSLMTLLEGEVSLKPEGRYVAEILSLPAKPIYVWVHGAEENVAALTSDAKWQSLRLKNILATPLKEPTNSEKPLIGVEIRDNDCVFTDLETDLKIGAVDKFDVGENEDKVVKTLHMLSNWIRMRQLENENSPIKNMYEVNLVLQDKGGEMQKHSEGETSVSISDELHRFNIGNQFIAEDDAHAIRCNIGVKLNSVPQDLYFYSFSVEPNGTIVSFNDEESGKVVFDPNNIQRDVNLLLKSKGEMFAIGLDSQKFVVWFKVIVTTEELDYQLLEQRGLEETRLFKLPSNITEKIANEWAVHTFKLTFERTPTPVEVTSSDD